VEETAESAYQRKAAAAYDKYGARDERRQPLLPASLQAPPLLPGVDHEPRPPLMLTRPCRAVHPPQHNTALGTLGPQVANALSRVLVPPGAAPETPATSLPRPNTPHLHLLRWWERVARCRVTAAEDHPHGVSAPSSSAVVSRRRLAPSSRVRTRMRW